MESGLTPLLLATLVAASAAVAASGHAALYKRDDRGTMLWIGLIWSLPLLGPALYLAFGVNRIKRRAASLRRALESRRAALGRGRALDEPDAHALGPAAGHLAPLVGIVGKVTGQPLLAGNRVTPLLNADAAYPEMLHAIDTARHTVSLATYIFDYDEAGLQFALSLGAAVRRGVQVRVLIDATGTLFARRSILGALRREGVPFARFLPAIAMGRPVSLNLRNHRKLLVADGRAGFTGGMNLCVGHLRSKRSPLPIEDIHFRVEGPVVAHLQEAFVEDWWFTTDESLGGAKWFPALAPAGTTLARGIADGPDENLEQVRWTILGAIAMARRSLRILSPYFLPDAAIISALNLAAMRGVAVDILLPTDGDVPFVQWASAAHWWQLLEHGCRIWVAPPPFDHSKLFVVDEAWTLLGSANWDPRSLRLNFEFNLECYDAALAGRLAALFDERKLRARAVTMDEVNARPLRRRLRNGIARLFAPFL